MVNREAATIEQVLDHKGFQTLLTLPGGAIFSGQNGTAGAEEVRAGGVNPVLRLNR